MTEFVVSRRDPKVIVAAVDVRAVAIPVAAQLLAVSESTLRRLIDRGEFPSVKFGERVVIPLAQLDDWLATHTRRDGTLQVAS